MVITILIIAKKYLTYLIIVIATQLSLVHQVIAGSHSGWWQTLGNNVAETWQQPEHYDLYIPAITRMHVLLTIKKKRIVITNVLGVVALDNRVGTKKATGMACT